MSDDSGLDAKRVPIERAMLQNYMSIARCDVKLGPLTLLVGPNGSGKSNFVDAFTFVSDALNTTLDQALRDRGGIEDVRRRSGGHPNHFGMRFDLNLPDEATAHYSFKIAAVKGGGFAVQREQATVFSDGLYKFDVRNGSVTGSLEAPPPAPSDRLYLVTASGFPEFRPLFELLRGMAFYNLEPSHAREHQPPDSGDVLLSDGRNVASVVGRLARTHPERHRRIEEYLSKIVPGLSRVQRRQYGARETLEFHQEVLGRSRPWTFSASSMSDGTLRALGVLVALLQIDAPTETGPTVSVVGIEEPEVALHPAATGVLLDALLEASAWAQVLVTTHSPDLLDSRLVPTDSIRAVRASGGVTQIGEVDDVERSAIRDGLYTAGDLLRSDYLSPEPSAIELSTNTKKSLRLFE